LFNALVYAILLFLLASQAKTVTMNDAWTFAYVNVPFARQRISRLELFEVWRDLIRALFAPTCDARSVAVIFLTTIGRIVSIKLKAIGV